MKFIASICVALACTVMASGCAAQGASQAARSSASQASNQLNNTLNQGSGTTQGSAAKGSTTRQGSDTKYSAAMMNPAKANEKAPEQFYVKFDTTKGTIVFEINRKWAPNGADRFYNLVKIGYFKDIAIFRAIRGFMFQFGIHGDPAISKKWSNSNIPDDRASGNTNAVGTLTFAHAGPNTRSTQMFVNLGNNKQLDPNFPPIGKVVEGMDIIRKINTQYGENPRGENIQGRFEAQGNNFIMTRFPNLDVIKSAEIVVKK